MMKKDHSTADRKKTDKPKQTTMQAAQAPWPDQKARQEMSERELALEDGKHDKNPDWKKTW
jgi:hypothetical protein